MKKLIATITMLLGACAMQPLTEEQKTVEAVLEVPGLSKDAIFSNAKAWIAETFVSAKAVTEDSDKESSRIIGNANMDYPCTGLECVLHKDHRLGFTLRIDAKDGKFKATYTNIKVIEMPTSGQLVGLVYMPGRNYDEREPFSGEMADARKALIALSEKLQAHLQRAPEKSNW